MGLADRPEVRNAINKKMQEELAAVWTAFRYDDEVRCVVLTGEGPCVLHGHRPERGDLRGEQRLDGCGDAARLPDAVGL